VTILIEVIKMSSPDELKIRKKNDEETKEKINRESN
jgi:hypothetical protein